jgi:hypothetical protein
VNELHAHKPEGAEDVYTPRGITDPALPTPQDDIGNDHTFTGSWHPGYPEKMRREEAKAGSGESVHPL